MHFVQVLGWLTFEVDFVCDFGLWHNVDPASTIPEWYRMLGSDSLCMRYRWMNSEICKLHLATVQA